MTKKKHLPEHKYELTPRDLDDIERDKKSIESLAEKIIRTINSLTITETDRQLRLADLDNLVERLRKARYEADEKKEEELLQKINDLTRKESSFLEQAIPFNKSELNNVQTLISLYKEKITASWKKTKEEKLELFERLDKVEKEFTELLSDNSLTSEKLLASERYIALLDELLDIIHPFFDT